MRVLVANDRSEAIRTKRTFEYNEPKIRGGGAGKVEKIKARFSKRSSREEAA
jgi:hypothetical protein